MKNLLFYLGFFLTLLLISCQDESTVTKMPDQLLPIISRDCPGDWTQISFAKGKCKNGCEKGLSVRCGGYILKKRCGQLTISIPTCDEAYSENNDWEPMPTLAAQDTADAVDVRIEFPDRYHARFVFLEDISDEIALDSDFTISNNIRWEDQLGFTFSSTTYYNFQWIGGDYPITITDAYPFGMALVDMSTY